MAEALLPIAMLVWSHRSVCHQLSQRQCFSLIGVIFLSSYFLCFTVPFHRPSLWLSFHLESSPSQHSIFQRLGCWFCYSALSLYLLVRFKLLCGSLLFHKAAWTTLELLDRIQYAAARVILGVLLCTPVNPFGVSMPLSRSRWLSHYTCRVLSVPGNHFRDVIHNYHFYFYFHQRLPLPVSGRIFHELQPLGIMFPDIPSVLLLTRYEIFSASVYRCLHTFNKDSIAPLH